MTDDPLSACHTAALRILQFRFNSEAELRRKLTAKHFDKPTIDEAVARLRDEKWLDDQRFANAWVRSRTQKRFGPQRIRRELMAAGIDEDAADAAIAANSSAEQERTALLSLLAKRRRSLERRHGSDFIKTDEGRNKLASWLLKQGYDAGLVFEVMDDERRNTRDTESTDG